MEEVSIVEDPH